MVFSNLKLYQRFVRVSAALILILLAGCAIVRLDLTKTTSEAFRQPEQTLLGRNFVPPPLAQAGHSGFYVLDVGLEAFAARAALADSAERTLDLQYYLMHDGQTTRLLTERLMIAAERGVRLRILLDGLEVAGRDPEIAALIAQPNIEVRLYNPFVNFGMTAVSRLAEFLGDAARLNRRMHNKLWVADNAAAIVGGRNLSDEYFDATSAINFVDLDLLAVGPVVTQLSHSFDEYWNSDWAVRVTGVGSAKPTREESDRYANALKLQAAAARNSERGKGLTSNEFGNMVKDGTLPLIWVPAHVVFDRPVKTQVHEGEDPLTHMVPHLRTIGRTAKTELTLISPYFVPSGEDRVLMSELAARGVRVRVLTNSLASTDVPVVHSGYARYRAELLRNGIELYEMRPVHGAVVSRRARIFGGSSNVSLHAKVFIVDRQVAFVGSMNLDPRSRHLNTELGVVIEGSELASQLAEIFDEALQPRHVFRVSLRSSEPNDDSLTWYANEHGQEIQYYDEPLASVWKRLWSGLSSFLAPEDLL